MRRPHHTATGDLFELIDAQAKPGDKEVIAALNEYKADEDSPNVVKKVDALLEKLK